LPSTKVQVQQIDMWFSLWETASPDLKDQIRKLWPEIRDSTLEKKGRARWASICGPVAATIAVVAEAGWNPVWPDRWAVDKREAAHLDDDSTNARAQITTAFRRTVAQKVWNKAALHPDSRGLEQG